MKKVVLVRGKSDKWVATNLDYTAIVHSEKSYSALREKTAGRSDLVFMKIPAAGKGYTSAN